SANAATIGRAALVVSDALAVHEAWLTAIALSFEAFRANLSILEPRVLEARPARGQVEIGTRLRALLDGSALFEPGAARRVQDPLSLRVAPQVHGALHWILDEARAQLEIELNSAADVPTRHRSFSFRSPSVSRTTRRRRSPPPESSTRSSIAFATSLRSSS